MPDRNERADVFLVSQGFASSRAEAQAAIQAGRVEADGQKITKSAQKLREGMTIQYEPAHPYVSRGGVKLAAALDHFSLSPEGRICVDIGASTGGFTQVLLERGATRVYAAKYAALSGGSSPQPYRIALLGDDLFLTSLPMIVVALLTVMVSQSLFPDERDFRILGPLPVRRIVIVRAKFAALLLFAGLFVGVILISIAPMVLLTSISRFREYAVVWRVAAWLISSLAASVFSVLAITAVVGVLMLVLSRTRLHSLTALTRSIQLAALVLCVPFIFHLPGLGRSMAANTPWLLFLPPAWFVGLQRVMLGTADPWFVRLSTVAVAAFVVASFIVAGLYILLFRHFERLLLRPPSVGPGWFHRKHAGHADDNNRSGASGWTANHSEGLRPSDSPTRSLAGPRPPRSARVGSLARSFAGVAIGGEIASNASPHFRAVHRFTIATLARSQLHQAVVLGLSACGLALALSRLVSSDLAGRVGAADPPSSLLINAVGWTPFALMFVCGISIRAAVALPMTHQANWIFRLTESSGGRPEQMRAVNHVVTAYVVGMPLAVAVPVLWLVLGPVKAVTAAVIVGVIGSVFVHIVLLDWRRIPFTCSYLPGKRLVAHTMVFGFAAFALFTSFGAVLIHVSMVKPSISLAITIILFAVAWMLRQRRFAMWQETPLIFDDDLPDQPVQLGL